MSRNRYIAAILAIITIGLLSGFAAACGGGGGNSLIPAATSASGVAATRAEVKAGADNMTTEQRNIKKRLALENMPGSTKHLYVISAMSGQVLLYSTVDGKVTSSSKRLAPSTVVGVFDSLDSQNEWGGFPFVFNGKQKRTAEVLQDDGTYGSSMEYIYWFDSQGVYHQHYVSGGQILHLSDQPIQVKGIVLNLSQEKQ